MDKLKALKLIQSLWLNQLIINLEVDSTMENEFKDQLSTFFENLTFAVNTGDPTCLDPILIKWADSSTQTELIEGNKNNTLIFEQMLKATLTAGKELLTAQELLLLFGSLLPIFIYAINKTNYLAMETRISFVSSELFEAKTKLERLDQSKSKFIGVAAHELKTPLTLIDGYTSMLKDLQKQSPHNNQVNMCLDGIHSGTNRLRTIVNDMIDVSRIDNNLLSLSFQPVWLNQLFRLLKSELLPSLTARKQILELKSFTGEATMLFADPERLHQSFRNILTNAIKYTPDGGSISIDGRSLPGFVEVIFSDTGIGISEEDQLLIFGKFGQSGTPELHSSGRIKFKGGGPGLGLTIARGIIEAHGGAIWAESSGYNENECPGSTFHVMLPVLSEPPDPKLAQLLGIETRKFDQVKDNPE
jgi:signal transduction histidine kinase